MEFENESFPVVNQPKRIKINLFNHQLTSIFNMENLEYNLKIKLSNLEEIETRIGVLSDLTGYGKTFSILGLIERDKMILNNDLPFVIKNQEGNNLINKQKVYLYKIINSTLIVLNQSLLTQWETELSKTSLNYAVVNSKKVVDEIDPNEHEIILCNCTMYQYLISRFRKFCWKRLVLDEPLTLKLTDFNNFAFGFIWLMSATPYEIIKAKNSTLFSELFAENEELFSRVIIKNPDDYIKKSFSMPENIHIHHNSYDPISKILEGIVSPILYEMIVAGNIKDAIKYLGGVSNTESLFYLIKNKKVQKWEELQEQIKKETDEEKIIKLKARSDGIFLQIEQLGERLEKELEENCVICSKDLNKPVFLPCCQNIICSECVLTWLCNKPNCPLCRCVIKKDELIIITDKKEDQKHMEQLKGRTKKTKPQIIVEIISEKRNGKFIIFSNYDESFEAIKNLLDEKEISYCELKGGKDIRSKNINSYKNETTTVLFLNSKANAAGINLQETTDIILYHSMNEYCQTQILGRANRIGRKDQLIVHHLI